MNCTPLTPTASAAFAVTFSVPDTVASLAGAVSDTVGAVVSATVTLTVADVRDVAGRVARDRDQRVRSVGTSLFQVTE